MRGRGRGRGRGARGRRGAISRGRGKKNVKVIESDDEDSQQNDSQQQASGSQDTAQQSQDKPEQQSQSGQETPAQDENLPPKIDLEADISQLEAPTFTTLNRGPPEPMLHLRWDHKVSLIGEKVLNPMIHSCDQCNKPILIYGRMIPCKHVFCLSCARKEDKACPRCMDPVSRVEQTNLGTVFMCTHGGSRYGSTGCRRTYLSQRDLQAHINHRHSVTGGDASPKVTGVPVQPSPQQPPPLPRKIIPPSTPPNDPRAESGVGYRAAQRTNLITVPIQQEPPPPPPPPPQQPPYHPQGGGVTAGGGYGAPPPPPPPPVQYGGAGYPPTGYYPPAPPTSYPPPQYPPPPPPDQPPPPQQYWQHPPPIHQFYR